MFVFFPFLFLIRFNLFYVLQIDITEQTLGAATLLQVGFAVSNITILIIVILVLLLLAAITSGAKASYFSLSAKDVNYLKTNNKQSSRMVVQLLEQPKVLLATMLVTKIFINIAVVITTHFLLAYLIGNQLTAFFSLLIQLIVITFLLVLFGEVLPKVYAAQNNMRMTLFAAPVLNIISGIFGPVSRLLVSSTNYLEEKIATSNTTANFSNEDFEQAIEVTMGHTASQEEVNIFKGIIKFSNISVRQIMHTRLDVSGIPYGYSFSQVQRFAIESGYSRMPVYKDSLDTIVGMVNSKDLLPHIEEINFDWHALIRPAYYVHENKMIEDLLKEFQQKHTHFAIVVDEFGGTSGIVTLEDIMEEIIGDIKDEFDEDDLDFKKIDENNFIFEGKTLINDVCRSIGEPAEVFDEIRGESDSLAGLILEIGGKFPAINETVSYKEFDFTVLEIDRMRIKRVKLAIEREAENKG